PPRRRGARAGAPGSPRPRRPGRASPAGARPGAPATTGSSPATVVPVPPASPPRPPADGTAGASVAPWPEQPGGEHRRLRAPFQTELRQQAGDVVLHRLLGQEHPLGDLPVGQPLRDVLEDPPLLLGERPQLLRRL